MGPGERNVDELLLDLHLNRVSQEDREWLEAELERDAGMRERSDRVGRLLQPLDHWSIAPAPGNLIEMVLARVQNGAKGPRRDSDSPFASRSDRGRRAFPLPRPRDFVAVAACLLLKIGRAHV